MDVADGGVYAVGLEVAIVDAVLRLSVKVDERDCWERKVDGLLKAEPLLDILLQV